jgi:hypothetical protein
MPRLTAEKFKLGHYPMTIPFEFSRRIKGDRDGLAKFERANF